jgi:hypothetical protein
MAGISNSRNLIISDVPRVLFAGTKRVAVTADTTSFQSSSGVPTPSSITLTANLYGISGTVNWTVPFGTATLSSSTGASVTLAYGDMSTNVITVRASVIVMGVTYTSDLSISKVADGTNGTDGTDGVDGTNSRYVVISFPSQVFSRTDTYQTFAPSSITLTTTVVGGVVSVYQWYYWNGSAWILISGATSSSYTVASGDFTDSRTYKVLATINGSVCPDEVTLVKLTGGTNALNGYLTNESITFATDAAGTTPANIATLTAGVFRVYYGTTEITGGCTFTKSDVNCTTSITNGTGAYSASAVTNDNASSTFTATHTSTGLTFVKVLSLAKSRTGVTGDTGATGLTGAAVDMVFVRSATQPATPTSTFTPPTAPITWYSNVNSVPVSSNPMWSSVGKKAAGASTWTWETPIKVEGTDGAAGSTPNVVTEVYVYRESFSTPLTPTGGTYSLATNTFTTLPTDWVGSMPVVGTLPIYQSAAIVSAPAGGSDSTLTWSSPVKIYENADDGIDAKLMSLSASSQVFQISKAGVATPASITLKAIRNNITGSTFTVISGTATLTSVSGDNATLLYTNMGSEAVTIEVKDATTSYVDTITIVKVREGSDALVGYLTNENVTLPAQTDGTVVSYAGASGKFIVLRGATDVTDQCTFAVQANPQSLTPTNNIVTSGTNAGDYMITGGFTTDTASVTYRATYVFNSLTYYVDKVFTLSKSKTGTTGAVGSAGSSARIAYVKTTGTLSPTPSTSVVTGDVFPTTGTWGEVNAWIAYPPTITTGEQVWQTTGVYNYLTNQTTWVSPYLSNLKVGNLSAITINTGTLTVDASGYVRGGQTGYNTGSGFWLGYDSGAYKFSIGNATQSLTWNGSALTLKGNLQVNDAALSGTTMTGGGAQFNASGTFALGTSANNITYNGTDLTLNGVVNVTSEISFRTSAFKVVKIGGSGVGIVSTDNGSASKSILGIASGTNSSAVYGQAIGLTVTGVYGEANTGVGVFGETGSGKAIYGFSLSTGYALYSKGRFGLDGTTSPIELNTSQGTTGQTLISQGTGNTPAWGNRVAGGAATTDGSGNATISVVMGSSTFGFSGTTTSGAIVTITSVTNTGGNNYDVVIQTQYATTGAAYPSRGVRWIAIG